MTMKRPKVSIIGAGNVGAAAGLCIAESGLADVVLVDVVKGVAEGKALDISQSLPILGVDSSVVGSSDYALTANSDVVVITAGVPRKPGMTREDLLAINAKIVREVTENVVKHSKNPLLIVVSNPLDAMLYVAYKASKLPKSRVMGMAGCLDSTRFKRFIADKLNVPVKSVNAMVIGGHGDAMVPLVRLTTVNGAPLNDLLDQAEINAIVHRTRNGGGEFLPLLNTSAWIAPGRSIAQMVEAILLNKKEVLPISALLEGEYGYDGFFIGVPCVLGLSGVEKIVELDFTPEEKTLFDKTASQVKETVEEVKKLA